MSSSFINNAKPFALLFAALLGGCAEGPFNGGGTLNPWLRQEWERDERRGPTFHTRMAELRSLRNNAASLPAEKQEELSRELSSRFKQESNPLVRAALVETIGSLNGSTTDEVIQMAAVDSENEVRAAAVRAAGRRGNENALKILSQTMSGENELDVRLAAARELGRFKNSPEAVRALALGLEENDAALQHRSIESLEKVTGRSYGMSVPAWRDYLAGGNPTPAPAPSIAQQLQEWKWW